MRFIKTLFALLVLGAIQERASAFALLGPFTPWMSAELSYRDGSSIGGPMDLGHAYRWNVPLVTYAYDASFLNYFGSNGVEAVEGAIQTLNDLAPVSALALNDYPNDTSLINFAATRDGILDLKSGALSFLLEQMGLAQPQRFTFVPSGVSYTAGVTNYEVLMRNFDPGSLEPSALVNGTLFTYDITSYQAQGVTIVDARELAVDPQAPTRTAVAEGLPLSGTFFTGLSHDDVGGWRYLLSTNHIAVETLLPGVSGTGPNADQFVTTAARPGVDKITFRRVDYDQALHRLVQPLTNLFVDRYFTNNELRSQSLQRVVEEPDILFSANYEAFKVYSRSGTTNWANNSAINANPGGEGPGIIRPPISINFSPLRNSILNFSGAYPPPDFALIYAPSWGSYSDSTNPPVLYPATPGPTNTTSFHLYFLGADPSAAPQASFSWDLVGESGAQFLLQTSTNLIDWVDVWTIPNLGGHFNYGDHYFANPPQRYFRTIRQ